MIKKTLLLMLLSVTILAADFNPSPYHVALDQVQNNKATIKDNNIQVGATGIVLHSFDNTHKTIIALAEVIEKKEGKLLVSFKKFSSLKQSALPSYKISPSKGDELILNYLYNRVLPITPNKAVYQEYQNRYAAFSQIHPDIFASSLYIAHQPRPTKNDFQESCRAYDYNLLFFAVAQKGYFVDCNSFKILDTVSLSTDTNNTQKPFYSRIPEIKNRLGGIMGTESIGEYDRYYKNLLGIKNAR